MAASSAMASSSSSISSSVLEALSRSVCVKLTDANYYSWRQQVDGVLRSHNLLGFIVQPVIPDRYLNNDDLLSNTVNPEYTRWEQQDSMLFTWLLSTLSESVLPSVINCRHSWQI